MSNAEKFASEIIGKLLNGTLTNVDGVKSCALNHGLIKRLVFDPNQHSEIKGLNGCKPGESILLTVPTAWSES